MPLTLDEAEKLIQAQADEIKSIKTKMEMAKSTGEFEKLEKRLDEVTAKFDELHAKYEKQTVEQTGEAHQCFWCV